MNVSHATAGRACRVDGSVFFSELVKQRTQNEPEPSPPAAPYAWKRTLEERIWSPEGPSGVNARAVLVTLVRHADAAGRTWMAIATIRAKTGLGNARTVRKALETLVAEGWLQVTPQTWASLTIEQTAAGRPAPRRGDVGQAPNLYVVLDGRFATATLSVPAKNPTAARPGLARIAALPPAPVRQMSSGGLGQMSSGPPGAKALHDLDPVESGSRKVRGDSESSTHSSLNDRQQGASWSFAWNVIVAAHAAKTVARFGLEPSKPDVRVEQRQAMAECLLRAAIQVQKKLEMVGRSPDVADLQRELADRLMRQYFKHDSEHLKRVKWALRDLGREIDARMIEAMQQLLRDSHEPEASAAMEVPKPLAKAKPIERPVVAMVDNARQAQRIIDMLERPTSNESMRRFGDRLEQKTRAQGNESKVVEGGAS